MTLPPGLRPFLAMAAALSVASIALAQTAASSGILAQGGQCLDLEGTFTDASPPPSGTRVVARPCSGRPSQRWTVLYGDYDDVQSVGGREMAGSSANANAPRVIVAEHGHGEPLGWRRIRSAGTPTGATGTIRSYTDRCVTLRGAEVVLLPCVDGDARQRWELR